MSGGGPASATVETPISAAFGSSCAFVIDRCEGGSVFVTDTGGDTRFGISKRSNPDVDIESLTRLGAMALYHDRYWRVLSGDQIPRGLDLLVFDAAVNLGCPHAVRLLQRVLRISEDGLVGPATLAAVKAWRPQSELRTQFSSLRMHSYQVLAEQRPDKYAKYMHGWRARCFRVADEAGRIGGSW